MSELKTCEYYHQKGDKEGDRCDKVPKNKNRRFCGKHHNYLFWKMELAAELFDERNNEKSNWAMYKLEVLKEDDLYK